MPRLIHSGNKGIFQGESPEKSHSLPSSYFSMESNKGEHPNCPSHTAGCQKLHLHSIPLLCQCLHCRLFTCELAEPTAMKHGSWQAWGEPRVTNIQQDSSVNKPLLFTEAGSVTSKACAEHSRVELCSETRPALHTGGSEAFPPKFPEPSPCHWFKAQRWAENAKTILRIYFPTILINSYENHIA